MKNFIFFALLIHAFPFIIFSQTNISGGTVNGTWTLSGSPYQIQGNIQINNGTTLIIEPGVDIIFQGYYKLNVQGKLLAVGNSTDSITFTSADTITGWQGIKFINTPDIGISEISYCEITFAKGSTYGGAIYFENYSAVVVSHCRIAKCSAGNGGAIGCWTWSDPVIRNNLFEYNSTGGDGGAIWCMGSYSMQISNNIFINNTANSGGGIYCYVSSPHISNNIIANNTAALGGGICANNNSSPALINNTIVNNSAENGGGLYSSLTSFPIVHNTIIWGNSASLNGQQVCIPDESDPSFYYCNIQGGQAAFYLNGNSYFGNYQNNIDSNPLFVSSTTGSGVNYYAGTANWSLQNNSPCIDNGAPNLSYPETDIAGNYRVSVCIIDIGSYEYQKGGPLSLSFSYSESYLCNGGSNGLISVNIAGGGGGPYSYLWNNGGTLQNTSIVAEGIYSVTVTDSASLCHASSNETIIFNSFIIDAGDDKTCYCTGIPVQLDSITTNYNGNQPLIYVWQPSTGLNNPDIPNPVATPNTSVTYTVSVSTSNGCSSSAYIGVELTPLFVDAGTASIYCGDSLQLNNLVTNYTGNGQLSYQWAPSAGLNNDTLATPTVYVNQDTKYFVTITTPAGCTAYDSLMLDYQQKPLKVSNNSTIVCGSYTPLSVTPAWVMMKNFEGGNINSIHFVNADTGFAVGAQGLIIKTTNGGKSWQTLNSNTSKSLNDIYFLNDTLGFVVGGQSGQYGIILKTTNAGITWTSYTLGTTHTLHAVYFTNTTTGYAVGGNSVQNYIIMKTTNGGNTWTTIKTGSNSILRDIVFINETTGYAVGYNGLILKTTNAGTSWDVQISNTTTSLYSVSFVDELKGFAAGAFTTLKTVDGGINWEIVNLNNVSSIYGLYFLSTDTVYIVAGNKIFYTYDGGIIWDFDEFNTLTSLRAIHFSADGTGYAMGTNGVLAKLDKPLSYQWIPSNSLSSAQNYFTLANPDSNTTYTVAVNFKNGCVSYDTVTINVLPLSISLPLQNDITCGTKIPLNINYINQPDTSVLSFIWTPATGLDNANAVTPLASPHISTTYSVQVTTNNGCSTSQSTLVNVTPLAIDAGADQTITCGEEVQLNLSTSWIQVSSNNFYFKDLYFTSADTGYAVSVGVYKSTDGGNSWQLQSQQVGHNLQSVYFTDKYNGYAVGNDGIIFKTTDGNNWNFNWIYSTQLKSVFFINTDTGYVVGDAGKIYKTENGADDWTLQSSGTTQNLKSVFFTTTDIGFVVGENGTYLKTVDGGATWTSETVIGSFDVLNDVFFPDVNNGFIAGSGSVFLKTTDGGMNWTPMNPNWFEGKSIYFFDANTGYIAGMFGAIAGIAKTTDGGNNWTNSTYNNITSLYGMHFPTPTVGYALGNGQLSNLVMKLPAPPDALTWSPNINLSDTSIANPFANPITTTTYTVSTLTGSCPATDSVIVYVAPLTVDAGQNIWDTLLVCRATVPLDSVQTNLSNTNGLTYQWLPSSGLNIDTIPNPTADITASITYHVVVNSPNGCTATDSININLFPLTVNTGQDLFLYCGDTLQLDSVIHNYHGTDTIFYQWAPSIGLSADDIPNPIVSASNTTYTVTISTNDCEATDELFVTIAPMTAPEICIVSVDSSNRNIVVWEKQMLTAAVDSFYIYKETNQTGNYIKIGSVAYDDLSIFIDQNSQPQVQSNRYKISLLDSCGLETTKSSHHKTMHLTINQGMGNTWNLIWEPYEGFTINTYNIYRGTHPDTMTQIGTMAGVNTQYSDINAPSGFVYYQIEIIGNWCNPSKAYNYSRSNIATNNPSSIFFSNNEEVLFNLFPNPAKDAFFIEPSSDIKAVKIFNVLGQIVTEKYCCFEKGIDINHLKNGLYYIEILSKKGYTNHKIIKE